MTKKSITKSLLGVYVRGLFMGTADVIPGVSGGTIALVSGIYPRLISALESVQFSHALSFLGYAYALILNKSEERQRHAQKIQELDWVFLLPLLAGIGTAVFFMVRVIPFVLEYYSFHAYAFFSGLILVSLLFPLREMHRAWPEFTLLIFFAILFFILTGFEPFSKGSGHPLILFLCGALAVCVLILPGISGSYVLVLLGQYKLISTAARDLNFAIVLPFALGLIVGILIFVRILRFFLNRYYSYTMACLTGMMLGSLRGIWPLRFVPNEFSKGVATASQVVPSHMYELYLSGLGMALLGGILVFTLDKIANKIEA